MQSLPVDSSRVGVAVRGGGFAGSHLHSARPPFLSRRSPAPPFFFSRLCLSSVSRCDTHLQPPGQVSSLHPPVINTSHGCVLASTAASRRARFCLATELQPPFRTFSFFQNVLAPAFSVIFFSLCPPLPSSLPFACSLHTRCFQMEGNKLKRRGRNATGETISTRSGEITVAGAGRWKLQQQNRGVLSSFFCCFLFLLTLGGSELIVVKMESVTPAADLGRGRGENKTQTFSRRPPTQQRQRKPAI